MERYHIPLILLSMGKNGSRAYTNRFRVEKPAFVTEDTIETTGAGDVFCACILHYILEHGWHEYNEKELDEMLEFANLAKIYYNHKKGARSNAQARGIFACAKRRINQKKMKYRLAGSWQVYAKEDDTGGEDCGKEIVDACGTTRQTFYRHFQDKCDLVNWYFDKILWNHLNIWEKARPSTEGLVKNFSIFRKKLFFTKWLLNLIKLSERP